ncbi:MAG TPA: S53 family peptidase [Jatrophihabitans sp.]|jgi:kumamolisin
MSTSHSTLPGSNRLPLSFPPDALRPLDPTTRIESTIVLRRRAQPDEQALIDAARTPLTRDQLAERYGADPADLERVRSALTEAGIEILETDPASRRVRIAGTAEQLGGLFNTSLAHVQLSESGPAVRHRTGQLSVPSELDGLVTAVLGIDNRPQAQTRFRVADAASVSTSYTPLQLATVYRMPAGTDGTGQTLSIIELGGGFGQQDLDNYFAGMGVVKPSVTAVSVDGAQNRPGQDPSGADGEVLLDIEVAGAIAPKAQLLVYFAPNTDAGFLDAVVNAAHANPAPTAISISWGQSEDQWTAQARNSMDQAFADAALLGVTVTVAAGDDGSADRATDSGVHVDFPAASPNVLACGGTSLTADPNSGAVTSETVWDNGVGNGATGGGVSDSFALPSWQHNAGVPVRADNGKTGRGVPDVSADADPRTGYQVLVDGTRTVIGGTSAVAPLWAALVCRLAQSLGKPLGLLQPAIYSAAIPGAVPPGFRDITSGNNGQYTAAAGWDACTGLGVPDGTALLAALRT